MSEDYGGVDPEESKLRRASSREKSAAILAANGVSYTSTSSGALLVANESGLNALARSQKEALSIEGVEAYCEEGVAGSRT